MKPMGRIAISPPLIVFDLSPSSVMPGSTRHPASPQTLTIENAPRIKPVERSGATELITTFPSKTPQAIVTNALI
jgi:hypothetical protein